MKRFLLVRRNKMGDMICALPSIHSLRRAIPDAFIHVLCDAGGREILAATGLTDRISVIDSGFFGPHGFWRASRTLQNFDAALSMKIGFDRKAARLIRASGAALRLGFAGPHPGMSERYFNRVLPCPGPDTLQIKGSLALIEALGLPTQEAMPELKFEKQNLEFASALRKRCGLQEGERPLVLNISSNRLALDDADIIHIGQSVLAAPYAAPALFLSATPHEAVRAETLARQIHSAKCTVINTPSLLDLTAALRGSCALTPECGFGHLCALLGIPTLVYWLESQLKPKWRLSHPAAFDVDITRENAKARCEKILQALRPLLQHPS